MIILLIFTFLAATSAAPSIMFAPINSYDNCHIIYDDAFNSMVMFWSLQNSNADINITLIGTTLGYVALGINSNNQPSMTSSDAMIGYVDGTGAVVGDYWLGSKTTCTGTSGVCLDTSVGGTNSIISFTGSQDTANKTTTIQYVRALDTGDKKDVKITNNVQQFVYAMNSLDQIEYHDTLHDSFAINLLTAATCDFCGTGTTCMKGCCVPTDSATSSSTTAASTTTGTSAGATTGTSGSTTATGSTTAGESGQPAIAASVLVSIFASIALLL